jgi:hypothetical protein
MLEVSFSILLLSASALCIAVAVSILMGEEKENDL